MQHMPNFRPAIGSASGIIPRHLPNTSSTFGITSSSAETAQLAETKIIQKDTSPDNSYYNNQGVQRVVRRKSKCVAQSLDQHVLMLKGLTGTHTIIYVQITLNIQTKSI